MNIADRTGSNAGQTVWVCVAVFNRISYTRKCLEQLVRQTYPNIKTVVVDDGSTDGTSAMIRAEHPEVVVLRGDGSLYWTGAMHRGVTHILTHGASDDYVLLLNDDLLFESDLVERLLEASRRYPQSLIQAVESCVDEPDVIWQGGVKLNWWTAKQRRINHHRRISEFPAGHFEQSDYLTARGVLLPMDVLRTTGNYATCYKQCGDPEFTRRAAKRGFSLLVCYDAVVLSYEKGKNLNEAESFSLSQITQYYFGVLSVARIPTRWNDAVLMTNSKLQAIVFFSFSMLRITWHFARRVKLRPASA